MTVTLSISQVTRRIMVAVAGGALCVPLAVAATTANASNNPAGQVRLPADPSPVVVPSLADSLINHWDFEYPVPGEPGLERDLGVSGTDLWLVNGGPEMRVQDGAYPASTFALQTKQVNPVNPPSHEDWKAGVFDRGGVESLRAFNEVAGITVMGWFKQTGPNPNRNTNSANPDAMFNAVGMAGVLSGDSDGHAVRALLEVINVNGELRLVALGRRIDGAASNTFAAHEDWETLFPQDEWVHIAATFDYDDGSMALYHNGQPVDGFYTNTGDPWGVSGPGPHFSSPTDPTGIKIGGSFPQNTGEQNPCNCRMDSLKFLDRVVTADEVAAQYQAYLDSPPDLARAKAGAVVSLRLALGGYRGSEPFAASSNQVACDSGESLGEHEPIATPGGSSTGYDQRNQEYLALWKTDRTWSGTCRQLVVTVDDGSVHAARFAFG
jgi:hypothetical protein